MRSQIMRSDPRAESWTAARYPGRAAMKLWIPTAHTLSLSGGFMVGLFYGDHVFPEIETAWGDPTTDIFLGVLCAIVASLIYDIVTHIRAMS
jgi:hypothetical protein